MFDGLRGEFSVDVVLCVDFMMLYIGVAVVCSLYFSVAIKIFFPFAIGSKIIFLLYSASVRVFKKVPQRRKFSFLYFLRPIFPERPIIGFPLSQAMLWNITVFVESFSIVPTNIFSTLRESILCPVLFFNEIFTWAFKIVERSIIEVKNINFIVVVLRLHITSRRLARLGIWKALFFC